MWECKGARRGEEKRFAVTVLGLGKDFASQDCGVYVHTTGKNAPGEGWAKSLGASVPTTHTTT